MDPIWKCLPWELTAMIMEQRCISNMRSKIGWLCDELQKHNAVIAGSFVMQCALEEYYISDVDVFIPYTHKYTVFSSSIDDHFDMLMGETKNIPIGDIEFSIEGRYNFRLERLPDVEKYNYIIRVYDGINYAYTKNSFPTVPVQPIEYFIGDNKCDKRVGINGINSPYGKIDSIYYTRNFYRGDFKINTIIVDNPIKFVETTFDADLCSLYYDGKCIKDFIPMFKKLLRKVITFNAPKYMGSLDTYGRCEKYKSRGFVTIMHGQPPIFTIVEI